MNLSKKHQLKNYLRFFVLLLGVSALLWNCEKEEFIDAQTQKSIELKADFSFKDFNDSSNLDKENLIINWDKYTVDSIESKEYFEFEIKTKHRQRVVLEGYNAIKQFSLLARYDEENEPEYFIVEFLPNLNNNTELLSYLDVTTSSYSGMIYLYTTSGNLFLIESYEQGVFEQQVKEKKLSVKGTPRPGDCTQLYSIGGGSSKIDIYIENCSRGSCGIKPQTTYDVINWYDVTYNNNTGEIVSADFLYTEVVGTHVSYYNTCGGNSGGSATSTSHMPKYPEGLPNNIEELLEAFVKIINNLEGNAKCVFKLLKDQSGNLFLSTIGKFIDNPNYHLQLNSGGSCGVGEDACTDGSNIDSGFATINIIDEGRGTLDLAALILHEAIHAEIYKYVYEYNQGVDPKNRENLLGYYFQYQDINIGTAQHQHMADKFVKPIAEAIRALDNNRYPLEDYMGFGWDGLRKYGWDGYYDNGVWTNLGRSESSAYYKTQKKVLDNTDFNMDCNE